MRGVCRVGKLTALETAQALVSAYLHEPPNDEDMDEFYEQIKKAQWLENRYFQNLADVLSKLLGGKK